MAHELTISPSSLALAFVLVLVALAISSKEKLGLNKDMLVAVVRMIVQLVVVGYILTYVFQLASFWVTLVAMGIMIFNSAWNAKKRAQGLPHAFKISLIAIFSGIGLSILILVLSGTLQFVPQQMIPITGMLAGNGMKIVGLCYNNLRTLFDARRQEVFEKLALGASTKQASWSIIHDTIKGALQPTIDGMRTLGLVTLPGMMTGMMMAGSMPLQAIMYQIMVYFMILSCGAVASILCTYLAYPHYFTDFGQLKEKI
ncbi:MULTISPECIES: iron export ABC transporter permease subunit FetB [Aerococcus]|uniref:Iron export ABC transporter permease subunit FetB n=1 Tax=Aerococcus sanguinicola TaxID=119206 RepID=A0A5N1GIR1_9LACT|nr:MULTISPECIES: iron export ABC transporter permease subunit FetB [Aerococcus]KAA9300226.1 iron export ABC transporter permease subunit FetB [Aerococcus sanguinicola]MDK6369572.1 iron export ABC transporter permease subunit FetB [Aerococcus sp. UMB9870]MDK6680060.1 iron export ABC transporter permease subunit FetB [Aerococcus sp. UMB8608]MDK6686059.1 iron export ABC transporter permease subunit FetB [Aerococcus sp. UMB8623]MDK6939839.1 iron export ABC transporter permease subunit FetB [Aeroco